MSVSPRCAHCGSRRDVRLFGNDPRSFAVARGIWPAGSYYCARCVANENRRALGGLRTPRLVARLLRFLRSWGRRP